MYLSFHTIKLSLKEIHFHYWMKWADVFFHSVNHETQCHLKSAFSWHFNQWKYFANFGSALNFNAKIRFLPNIALSINAEDHRLSLTPHHTPTPDNTSGVRFFKGLRKVRLFWHLHKQHLMSDIWHGWVSGYDSMTCDDTWGNVMTGSWIFRL